MMTQKKNKLTIGIEAQRIFRKKKHGMDIVAIQLIKSLQKIDTTNTYYIFVNPDEDPSAIQETENFKIIELPKSSYPVWEQKHLKQAAITYKLDVLHCTSNTAPTSCPVPLVLTLHDIIYMEKINLFSGTWYQRIGNLYRRWNVPKVVKKSHTIFTVSHFEKKKIDAFFHFKDEQVKVTYNGVAPHFQPQSPEDIKKKVQSLGLPNEYLLFLGNTDPKKNLPGVLKALKILDTQGNFPYDLVMPDFGEDELSKTLESIQASHLRSRIHLTGYIPNADLPYVYSGAKLFLYPSLRESFGLPILEAMACGCPVITSNTSSMPEVADDAAIIIDPFKPEEIASAVNKILADEDYKQSLIQKGFERTPLFSFDKSASIILGSYQEAANSKK
ncbi:glycosyltransferase family 4 protein [Mongoliitalea lutea]|uniref:Glycosyl transferase family 1 n=1 Tax=Mongoliitalea lutea TaxID=849756 RepID=A0A8J3G771_9BACT|nr:glycosyltransferase family 1 protein [Mongoliitalea lutea]GHB49745.1 glycosyl transferase family 1 [Mongoliitalea lutea]